MYDTRSKAEWHGKRDAYAKAVGGFAVAKMGDGTYDYFPHGQPPHQANGQVDEKAHLVGFWGWANEEWYWRKSASFECQRIARKQKRDRGFADNADTIEHNIERGFTWNYEEGWTA